MENINYWLLFNYHCKHGHDYSLDLFKCNKEKLTLFNYTSLFDITMVNGHFDIALWFLEYDRSEISYSSHDILILALNINM